ncbi:penicillin-binding protein activator [Amorphus orientalis]|uniref:ABC-type branched-subunit amino acid transport system substrate-binding protein n=1 Tax=Amorphus orientalis TaxID=649198 RepID=A0AAE3VP19_9HYPH|nr:penicillin-binding protein activator [Amorphus orientalis]MDQ0316179.1 ABC-type branched-subunit amino acid transport system substrate-binding protein [Amorphus orientalis]
MARSRIVSRLARTVAVFGLAGTLAACVGTPTGPQTPSRPTQPSQPAGEVIGSGSVPVALLLPMSAGGEAAGLATAFRNAAELAMDDFPNSDIRILVRDTGGTQGGAQAAAQAVLGEGAKLILGPVFSPAVAGAAGPARQAGVPVIAFSTDATVAKRGVYLLSFLPRQDADRIVSYAISKGSTSLAALVPDNGYGLVMEAAFREAVSRGNGQVVAVERYQQEPGDMAAKAAAIASKGSQVRGIFMPNGGRDPGVLAAALRENGLSSAKYLGSGQWDDPNVLESEALSGSWYPAPQGRGFSSFESKYQRKFGAPPPRTSSLAYDAASLAAGLVRARGATAFTDDMLTNPDGFLGVDGIFRFLPDGRSQRGLAVYEVLGNGNSKVVSPAPRSFTQGGGF